MITEVSATGCNQDTVAFLGTVMMVASLKPVGVAACFSKILKLSGRTPARWAGGVLVFLPSTLSVGKGSITDIGLWCDFIVSYGPYALPHAPCVPGVTERIFCTLDRFLFLMVRERSAVADLKAASLIHKQHKQHLIY